MSMYHVVHAPIRVRSDDARRPLHVPHMQNVLTYWHLTSLQDVELVYDNLEPFPLALVSISMDG